MFTKSARYYDAIYSFKDYSDAASQLHHSVRGLHPTAKTLLDLACGTGRHLEHLQHHYQVQGLDINVELLGIARARCPEVPLHLCDMASFTLDNRFDVVTCMFSSIGYVKTVENLNSTLVCMARHLNPGGLVLIEPWFSPERYWTGTITANHVDEPDLKIAWMYVSERRQSLSVLDIHYMVGTPAGVEEFRELHEIGLFTEEEYKNAFKAAGLTISYDPVGFFNRGLYIGTQPTHSPG